MSSNFVRKIQANNSAVCLVCIIKEIPMLRLTPWLLFILSSHFAISQTYENEVQKAGRAYERKNYDSCTIYFKNAFTLKTPTGADLYNAAVCNNLKGHHEQAFLFLSQAIRTGAHISKLRIDPELESLHQFPEWKKLMEEGDKVQADSFKTYQLPHYAARLARLWEEDQYFRFRLGNAYKNNDTSLANELWKKMRVSDSIVLLKLLSIIDTIGWPTQSKVGKLGASAAFLIIDHAPRDIMEKYFPYLEIAARNGEASLSNYATMKDRILVNRGKKQLYGTQKYWDAAQGKFVFFAIEDEKNINKLRKEVGLPPLPEFEL